jgi:hypothetical protein
MGMIIGMDPHKRSATIEVVDQRAQVCEVGRYGTDRLGYADMLAAGRRPTVPGPGLGDRGLQRHRQAHRAPAGARRGDRRRCAPETLGAGAGVRHRQRPQDRPGRRALGRDGRRSGRRT